MVGWQFGIVCAVGLLMTNGGPDDALLVRHLAIALSGFLMGASFWALLADAFKWLSERRRRLAQTGDEL